jgi:hypothetical protein
MPWYLCNVMVSEQSPPPLSDVLTSIVYNLAPLKVPVVVMLWYLCRCLSKAYPLSQMYSHLLCTI